MSRGAGVVWTLIVAGGGCPGDMDIELSLWIAS